MSEPNPFLTDNNENPFLDHEPVKAVRPKKKEMSFDEKNEYLNSLDPMHIISKKIQDVGSILGKDINNAIPAIGKMLLKAPSEIGGIGNQLAYDKPRLTRSLTLGAGGNILNALINTPPLVGHALHHYGLAPDIAGKMPYADFSPEIQKYLIGGERQPGDVLASNWPVLMQLLKGGKKLFGGGTPPPGDLPVPPELTAATEAHTQATRAAQREVGAGSPESLEYRIGNQREKIGEIDNEISGLKDKINQVKVPHVETGHPEPFEHAANLERASREEKNNVTHAEALHENAQRQAVNIENDIGNHLDTGAEHHVRAARLLKTDLQHLHSENNSNYTNLTSELEPLHITIDNTPRIQSLTDRVRELVSQGNLETQEIQNLGRELTSLSNTTHIPATQFIDTYKSLKGYVRDAYERAYERGENREEQLMWRQRAEEGRARLDEMENVLRNSLPENVYGDLKGADSFWRDNILPLYSEPLYWNIMRNEKLPKHMAESFAGGEQGSGKDIINRISRQNPQVLKHIIGERWDSGPNARRNILNPNERTRSYLNDMPELSGLVNNHQRAQASVNNAEHAVQGARFHHDVITDRLSEAKKLQEREQGAIDKSIQQRNKKMAEKEQHQQAISAKDNERKKIRQSIEDDIRHIERLTETRNKKESLEKSFKAQQAINKIKKQAAKKVSGWSKSGKLAKGLIVGEFGLKELKRILKHFED